MESKSNICEFLLSSNDCNVVHWSVAEKFYTFKLESLYAVFKYEIGKSISWFYKDVHLLTWEFERCYKSSEIVFRRGNIQIFISVQFKRNEDTCEIK